ncbi:MAG: hypothetical protein K6F72_07975 [Bacteroidales bacterium]|nr:hypothetical protein [Bacteroidales bacterium]
MKKAYLLLLSVLCLFTVNAQDIIYTTDGYTIEARNIKREGNAFRYSLYSASMMDMSTYMIDCTRVKKIKYEDGHVYSEDPTTSNQNTQTKATSTKHKDTVAQRNGSRDTVVAYATLSTNNQLTPRLFNAYPPYKSPALAFVGSMIIPGLGQMYNDEVEKGLVFLGADIVAWGLFYFTLGNDIIPYFFAAIGAGIHIVAPVEAAISADKTNQRHGYLALYPSINKASFAYADGKTSIVPSMTLSFSF